MDLIGKNAAISAILLTIIGYSLQIKALRKSKEKTEGVSAPMFILVFYMSASWLTYGIYLNNWNIISPNIPGAILSFIILIQLVCYKRQIFTKKIKMIKENLYLQITQNKIFIIIENLIRKLI